MHNLPKLFLTSFIVLAFGLGFDAFGQRRKPSSAPKRPARVIVSANVEKPLSPEKKARLDAFEKAWATIDRYYFDSKFNNLNWAAIKIEFERKVRAARDDETVHDLIEQMIKRLPVSHLYIIRPEVFEEIEFAKETARGNAGRRDDKPEDDDDDIEDDDEDAEEMLRSYGPNIEVRLLDRKFVVFRVAAGSSVETLGIRPGFILESVDDVALLTLLQRIERLKKNAAMIRRQLPQLIVDELLNGEQDSEVKLSFRNENDELVEHTVKRELINSDAVSMGRDIPESQLIYIDRSIDDDIGYVYFNTFALQTIEKFCSSIDKFKDKKAIVIDLRGNVGGLIDVSIALAGMLSREPMPFGTALYRHGNEEIFARPKAKRYLGRVAVLTDEMTVSAAEMLASAIQDSTRGRLYGSRTAGETLPSIAVELATGARLIYPIANFRSASGKFLEGVGVAPDRVVPLSRDALLKGSDPQLDAALAGLRTPEPKKTTQANGEQRPETGSLSAFPATPRSDGAPPPPPPPPAPRPMGTGRVASIVSVPEPSRSLDQKAVEIIRESERSVGGVEEYEKIKTYEMLGIVTVNSMGATQVSDYRTYRDGSNRLLTVTGSDYSGERRVLREKGRMVISSDMGLEEEIAVSTPVEDVDFLAQIIRMMRPDNFSKLNYLGIFDRDKRKVHLIDGTLKTGPSVAIYFDVETKLFAGYQYTAGGLSFSDYRKIGNVMFPYTISSGEIVNIQLSTIRLNEDLDPKIFEPKLNCYDRP